MTELTPEQINEKFQQISERYEALTDAFNQLSSTCKLMIENMNLRLDRLENSQATKPVDKGRVIARMEEKGISWAEAEEELVRERFNDQV